MRREDEEKKKKNKITLASDVGREVFGIDELEDRAETHPRCHVVPLCTWKRKTKYQAAEHIDETS